ncbi:CHASE3 domain-containing protein [Devosia sp.]|uniref:sensor histidine kinase n=1 Tax=Devosia sp. TaxID=1871048 RepID=UPI003264E17F
MTDAVAPIEVESVADRLVWRRIVVFISLALVFLAAAAAFFLAQGVDQQMQDVVRTYDLRRAARELTIALVDAESGQRGYLLTDDNAYLPPYYHTLTIIDQDMAVLGQLTLGNAEQTTRLDSISEAVKRKLSEMSSTIALVRDGHSDLAKSVVKAGEGTELMSNLRTTLDEFVAQEDQRLLERNQSIAATRLMLVVAILVALASAVVLTYVLFNRTQRQVSAMARSQDALFGQRDALTQRVQERTAELEQSQAHALRERERVETLLMEANHRIGNSLATVSSLLGLQMMRTRSPEIKEALEAARQRVHAIASAHRRLRLGDDLETTDAAEFLSAVLDDLQGNYSNIEAVQFTRALEPISIYARDATTLGILVSELVTNSLKHAFPEGRSGTIAVRLFRDPVGVATLEVSDDGQGVSDEALLSEGGLGSVIVKQLAQQFGGKPVYAVADQGGLQVTVAVPKIEQPASRISATL